MNGILICWHAWIAMSDIGFRIETPSLLVLGFKKQWRLTAAASVCRIFQGPLVPFPFMFTSVTWRRSLKHSAFWKYLALTNSSVYLGKLALFDTAYVSIYRKTIPNIQSSPNGRNLSPLNLYSYRRECLYLSAGRHRSYIDAFSILRRKDKVCCSIILRLPGAS